MARSAIPQPPEVFPRSIRPSRLLCSTITCVGLKDCPLICNVIADDLRDQWDKYIINGTVVCSPTLHTGSVYVTAAGQPLTYLTDGHNPFVQVGRYRASILRADVPLSNGVVHLIDTLMVETNDNSQRATEAVSSASSAAGSRTTTTNMTGIGSSTSVATASATGTATVTPAAIDGSHTRLVHAQGALLSLLTSFLCTLAL
ncbi:hypothetical protein IAR55_006238 [Kwoniella newhampshirensis]|uniref:FAS1 domain-containing protein n=1 Tax=Kwoniella newhampshirensis TaxID=1651941 RepID=A0AAW0YXX1_9TREE